MKLTHYHLVYLQDGHYKTFPVDDEFEAHHQIYDLSAKPDTEVVGVFDPRDWQFHWSIGEQDRQQHMEKVAIICKELE